MYDSPGYKAEKQRKLVFALADRVRSPARQCRGAAGDHAPEYSMKMEFTNLIGRLRSAVTSSNHTHNSQSHVTDIDHSDAMDILSSKRRRWAIEALADHPPDATVTVSDLAEEVAARENNCSVAELSSKERERVYISMVQTHLISMDDIVDYREDRKTITPTETPQRLWRAYRAFQRSLDG